MKKKIFIGIAVLVVVVGIWFAFNQEKATQMIVDFGMAMTSSVKHRDAASEKAKYEMTADDFSKAFKDNAVTANTTYINQAVLLEGSVSSVSGVTVTLNNIACNIDSSDLEKVKVLKQGDKVKIQGLVVGYNDLMEEIALAQCKIK
jgi:ABC-type lipoprotein release transport system permease subunit